ncbi:hypothetical protein CRM22_003266 [Opisthorchis felineus]|uniref:C2H2-type domain-containing protein n=1 Tax=Opisthorchis felineus TaxID=147828 RepID=A0A4S2M246_OPIFE|nr:hypothetical protein CRM22_003266 [Opisthorchis felineus]
MGENLLPTAAEPSAVEHQGAISLPKGLIEMVWQSPICSNVYNQSGYLVRHLENHSVDYGECVFCGSGHNTPSAMAWHVYVHHKEEMYVNKNSGGRHLGAIICSMFARYAESNMGRNRDWLSMFLNIRENIRFPVPFVRFVLKRPQAVYHAEKYRRFPEAYDPHKRPDYV